MNTGLSSLDAQALYQQLLLSLQSTLAPDAHLVGITTGGAWLAERLQHDLSRQVPFGIVSSSLHRDDFSKRGMAESLATKLPFEVEGAVIWLIDDVLFTGRTIRAVVNELYDYGRPKAIHLAVLVDRAGRELPIQADVSVTHVTLPTEQTLRFKKDSQGQFAFSLEG